MIADTVLHRLLNQERLHNLCDLRELPRIGLAQATVPALEEEDLEHTVTKITLLDLTIILVVSKHKIFRYFNVEIFRYFNVDKRVKEIKQKKGNAMYDFQFL